MTVLVFPTRICLITHNLICGFSKPPWPIYLLISICNDGVHDFQAYLRGDLEALSWRCRGEMLERCRGIFSEWQKAGVVQVKAGSTLKIN